MNDSVSKIANGLQKREAERKADSTPLASYVGAPATLTAITEHVSQIRQRKNRLRVLAEEITVAVNDHRETKSAEYAELGKVRGDNGLVIDELGDVKRKTLLERDVSSFAREKRAASEPERVKLRKEINTLAAKIAPVRESWVDGPSLLHRVTLGDKRRIDFYNTLATVGPRSLEVSLADAIATGDKALAAACLDRLDALPKNSKSMVRFSRQQAAETVMAEELRQARAAFAMLDIAVAEAEMEAATADGKRVSTNAKLKVGRLKRELAELLLEDDSEDGQPRILSDEEWERRLNEKWPAKVKPEPKPEIDTSRYKITDEEWAAMLEAARVDDGDSNHAG